MKNVKCLGFVGLGCALLLTGCGGSAHSLTCSKTVDSESETIEFEFNDKEDKVIGAEFYYSIEIPDDVTEDEIEEAMSEFKEECDDDDDYKNCNVSRKGNKLELKAAFTNSALEEDELNSSKKEIKEDLEDEGFTCK